MNKNNNMKTCKSYFLKHNKLFVLFILTIGAVINIQCSRKEVDTSQVDPAPPHASEIEDEDEEENGKSILFAVGGGTTPDSLMQYFVESSNVENPKVLIIPYAYAKTPSSMDAQLERFTDQFLSLGFKEVSGLTISNGDSALEQINTADIIWISGGLQNTLRNTLNDADSRLIPAIQNRYNKGLSIVGGTSAGAAILSDIMIGGDGGNDAESPGDVSISNGFGLWPEVIIDQHFTERSRLWRLENAISRNTSLIGIGIDESTAVLLSNKSVANVVGDGTVTVLIHYNGELKKDVYNSGSEISF